MLEGVLRRTIGPIIDLLHLDSADIIETGAAAFVDKLSIQGTIHLEATWAQLWVYPADRKDESLRLIDSKSRPALGVAVRIAGAVNPSSFGVGEHFKALDAELSPVLELIERLYDDPAGLVEDYIQGQYQLPDVNLREARSAASRLLSGLENLADSPGSGMTCPPATRTKVGDRQSIKRVCARTIYFGLLSGPERPVVGPDWPGAIEIYPVASINVHVLPQTSEVFLKHHGLFYTGQVELSYRTDIDAVLKEALEETARAMLKKAIERITDRLKSLAPDELKSFWERIRQLRRPR